MCGGGKPPKQPTVDPEAERRKAEGEAAANANEKLLASARRRRQQKGLLANDQTGGSVLSRVGPNKTGIPTLDALQDRFNAQNGR